MVSQDCLREWQDQWLPHVTDSGLTRLAELLEKASPLLIRGSFQRASVMGCLATQAAWHHPKTQCRRHDAGVAWLGSVVGLCSSRSHVIREWDLSVGNSLNHFELRQALLQALRQEQARRQTRKPNRIQELAPVSG